MKKAKSFYSSGEMAKMNGINKRTLHYYNDIGLFEPDKIGANGFHYYSCFQSTKLEMILTLRKIGMPIEEIKHYMDSPSESGWIELIEEKKDEINKTITELKKVKTFLDKKEEKIKLLETLEENKIIKITLPKTGILYSDKITGLYDDEDFQVAAEFSQRLKSIFGLYDNFGSIIPVESIYNGLYDNYTSFFAYSSTPSIKDDVMEEGQYLRTISKGKWSEIKNTYMKLIDYANDNNLKLVGSCYEEGLNEMSLQSSDNYITMITVRYIEK